MSAVQEENYRKMKQKFLREKIAEHQFDQVEFSEFLQEQRPDGKNIDVWEFDELIDGVQKFRKMKAAAAPPAPASDHQINF